VTWNGVPLLREILHVRWPRYIRMVWVTADATPKFSCRSPNCKVATSYTGTVMDLVFLASTFHILEKKIKVGLWDRHAVCVS
jgi:hypothetical protein